MQNLYLLEKIYYRIEDKLRPTADLPPEDERTVAVLPAEGSTVSVELALNSRCSSDYDGNPRKFHWGMFNRRKKLSEDQISSIKDLVKIPRLTDESISIRVENNLFTFLIDNRAVGTQKFGMMVESGMQQQAVALICSALGIGTMIKALGKNGIRFSCEESALIQIKLDAGRPTYAGSYWCEMAPDGRSGWLQGNLPDPARNSNKPLIDALSGLTKKHSGPGILNNETIGQLLWAARGRTPHLYKTKPWGMTIPTWGGKQTLSSMYLVVDNTLSIYRNWKNNRPTHSLFEKKVFDPKLLSPLMTYFPDADTLLVFGKNEEYYRSLWEIGYQLFNVIIQAKALDTSYEVVILGVPLVRTFEPIGVSHPVACIILTPNTHN